MNMQISEHEQRIQQALHRARARWLNSAMVNAGGRWAVLPGLVVAFAGIALGLLVSPGWLWLSLLACLGVAAVFASLLFARRGYAASGSPGAPDYALLLDRALGLHDALPAYLESGGEFRDALALRVASALDSRREKGAAPRRHFAPLIVALVLALLPLAMILEPPPQGGGVDSMKAEDATHATPPTGVGGSSSGEGAGSDDAEGASEGDSGSGDGGKEGEVARRPEGAAAPGGAGDPPPEAKPVRDDAPVPPNAPEAGDSAGNPTPPPEPKNPDIDSRLDRVRPEAGDGDKRTEDRSRWVYDPDGDPLTDPVVAPPDMKHPGEKAVPRTKLTSRERKLIEALYRRLHE